MRIVVLGAGGQVGHELVGALHSFADVTGLGRAEADLNEPEKIRALLRELAPDAVVNAASHNDVDGAEKEPETALRINAEAVAALGEEARQRRFALVHYSTDFVFDGEATRPYVETDPTTPLGAYGRSKLAGERALAGLDAPAIVLRTAWVYSLRRRSFVSNVLRLGRTRASLRVVDDQVGCPTFCRDLAQATALLLYGCRAEPHTVFHDARGVYHLCGSGSASRAELARATLELARRNQGQALAVVEPVSSADDPRPALRPAYAPLDCGRLRNRFGITLPPWRESLARALADDVS